MWSRTRSTAFTAVVNLLWAVGTASAMLAPVLVLMWACRPTLAPAPEGPLGPGIIVRSEVTTIWIPRALRDLARLQAGEPVDCPPEALETDLGRDRWRAAWYALTYRGHQANGGFAVITQIRHLSDVADHLEELQAVMATVAGRPPQYEGRDFSHARVEVIPDTLQAVDPREAIIRLMAGPVVGDKSRPTDGADVMRRTK